MTDQAPASWRTTSKTFVEIGRSLALIEEHLRDIRGTAVVDDQQASARVRMMQSAARRLLKNIDTLRFEIRDEVD